MPGDFYDSNIVLYLASGDPEKADRAESLLRAGGTISVQVLNEVTNIARRKMAMSFPEVRTFLASVRGLGAVEPLTLATHETGLDLAERYLLSWSDALIAASALIAGSDRLWTEDMQDGLIIDGRLRVENPFRSR